MENKEIKCGFLSETQEKAIDAGIVEEQKI